MSQLAKLQQAFQRRVLDPKQSSLPTWVSAGGRATPETQLLVYTSAYRARLTEVLAEDFPAIANAIGEDGFETLAEAYIDAHPSRYFSLRDFGDHMADFMTHAADYKDMPWLSELAVFERLLGRAFDATDAPIFREQDMAAVPAENWADLRFILHPSVQRIDCIWDAPSMWKVLTSDTPKEVTAEAGESVAWLVWRQQLTTQFRSLNKGEQIVLDTLREGATFNDACVALSTLMAEDEVPLHIATLLKSWITQELISGIK
ncbi:MAG: DNA-binding domain-containing protein [Acidiferrobacterales bacterium]